MALNMPSAYHLAPANDYFTHVDDPAISFSNDPALSDFRARYGEQIHSADAFANFLSDQSRAASSSDDDLSYPVVGNGGQYAAALSVHSSLDRWTPPEGVEVIEIAGWGEGTLATIEYFEGRKTFCSVPGDIHTCTDVPKILFNPREVIEGDGTVLVPSALWMPVGTSEKYWVNLLEYGKKFLTLTTNRAHADILEIDQVRELIKKKLVSASGGLPEFVTTEQPIASLSDTRLRFLLHSPLKLSVSDVVGNQVNSNESNIPGSRYKRYGEVQVITVPRGIPVTANLEGYAGGSFTFQIEEINGEGDVMASTTFTGIPSSTSTRAWMDFPDGTLLHASALAIDFDGNGDSELSLLPEGGQIILPDFEAPELQISYSLAEDSLALLGIDKKSETTTTITPDEIRVVDGWGNTLAIPLDKHSIRETKRAGRASVAFSRLVYNGVVTQIPRVSVDYWWEHDKDGKTKELSSFVDTGDTILATRYSQKRNETTILRLPVHLKKWINNNENYVDELMENKKNIFVRMPGILVPEILTNKGIIEVIVR
jgi:hypothetical protein